MSYENNSHIPDYFESCKTITQVNTFIYGVCKQVKFKPGWTDDKQDAVHIGYSSDTETFTVSVWNGGDSTKIREAIRDFYNLHEERVS